MNLDVDSFEKTIFSIIERHESLRCVFLVADGKIVQQIYPVKHPGFKIEYIDLSDKPDKMQQLENIKNSSSERVFDFNKGPLFEVLLIKMTAESDVVFLSMPHANCDATSLEILREEMFSIYFSFKENKKNNLKPLTGQYKEYTIWNNNWLESDGHAQSKLFYKRRIEGSLLRERSLGYAFPSGRSYKDELEKEIEGLTGSKIGPLHAEAIGLIARLKNRPAGAYVFFVGPEILTDFRKMAHQTNTSLFTVLVSTFAILFYQVARKEQFRIDVPITTRVYEEFENIVGWLMSSIIVCFDVDEKATLSELIKLIFASILEVSDHRFYALEKILMDLDLPLSEVVPMQMNLVRIQGESINKFSPVHKERSDAYFHFECSISEYDNALVISICYDKKKSTGGEIEEMMRTYLKMITDRSFRLENPVRSICDPAAGNGMD